MSNKSLTEFIQNVSGEDHLRVQDDLGSGFVRLRAAEAQRRQAKQDIRSFEDVVIELLRNSRDAHARCLFAATWCNQGKRFLTLLDDGDGIPESMHETVFEPFVTSKLDTFHSDRWGVHGRGMALYSIRQNVSEAKVLESQPGLGSVFWVENDIAKLGEKRDQSTSPSISKGEDGKPVLRGPHNILRTVLEFAIDERNTIAVYLGTPSEIVSTLYWLGQGAAGKLSDIFDSDTSELPYVQQFGACLDASELAELSERFGFPLSSRSAYRIMKGEIEPLPTHLEAILGKKSSSASCPIKHKNPAKNASSIRFSSNDLAEFQNRVADSYQPLAQAYYLNPEVQVSVKKNRSELLVRIPIEKASGN